MPNSKDLVIACVFILRIRTDLSSSNILQIYQYSDTRQLIPIAEHAVYGKIIGLAIHRPPFYVGQDHLFILTDNHAAFTCSWDILSRSLRNEKIVEGLYDSSLRPAELGEFIRTDPGNRVIGLSLHQGLLALLLIHQNLPNRRKSTTSSIAEGTILEATSLRMKVLNLVNFEFLRLKSAYPHIVILWKNDELKRFISVWEVDKLYKPSDRDFVDRLWANGQKEILVDQGANLLIPTRDGNLFIGIG
jgi:Mono-functional DNA-alkylating methyl methanesulfonate N-term